MGDFALPNRRPGRTDPRRRLTSDEWLARRASMGSARAYALLYGRHHQALYRYCRSIVRNDEDAQDVLQSTMMRALASLQAHQRDVAVRPWLFRIAHNEAVSLLRSRRPHSRLEEGHEPVGEELERTVRRRERLTELLDDLQSLAERQRAALVMRELSGLSIEDIATALSSSPGAAKQAIFEARCALQEFEEGRAMDCEAVCRAISDRDRRVLRGRKIRAHLRSCPGCRDFERMIRTRSAELRALAPPLPAAAATAMLARLLAQGAGGGHSAMAAATSGSVLGNHVAASVAVKALAAVVVVSAATAGAVHLASSPARQRPVHPAGHRSLTTRSADGGVREGTPERGRSATGAPGHGVSPHRANVRRSPHRSLGRQSAPGLSTSTSAGPHGAPPGQLVRAHRQPHGSSGPQAGRHSGPVRPQSGHQHSRTKPAEPAPRLKPGPAGGPLRPGPTPEHAPVRGGASHPLSGGASPGTVASPAGG